MKMNRLYIVIICLAALSSCEKVWEDDLQEKALDEIRGRYEIASAVWEGTGPIDIDGDGNASYDYYAEWNQVDVGWHPQHIVYNRYGRIDIPYTYCENEHWGGLVILERRYERLEFDIEVVIEGGESRLEFTLPDEDSQLTLTGYGELTLRTDVTFTVLVSPEETREVAGPVLFKFKRTEYISGEL